MHQFLVVFQVSTPKGHIATLATLHPPMDCSEVVSEVFSRVSLSSTTSAGEFGQFNALYVVCTIFTFQIHNFIII